MYEKPFFLYETVRVGIENWRRLGLRVDMESNMGTGCRTVHWGGNDIGREDSPLDGARDRLRMGLS